MHDAPHARRRNTAEEIRQMGDAQSRARTRGLVAVAAGVLSAGGLLGAFLLLSRPPKPPPPPPVGAREAPVSEIRQEPVADGPRSEPEAAAPRPGAKRPRDPIAALARPSNEAVRPAGNTVPVMRGPAVDLAELARSLATQKKGAVQLCFERELKRDPRLKGSAMVRVTLEAPHKLGAVSVHDDLDRATFTKCVKAAMRSLDFPSLAEDLTVELPFALKTPDL